MATKIKICGLQSAQVLESILHLPIDYIGLVFAESKRKVTKELANELIEVLQRGEKSAKRPLVAGVFVNPDVEELKRLLQEIPLDVVQLHGQESPDLCAEVRKLGVQVFKAVSVLEQDAEEPEVRQQLSSYAGSVDALLLDTYDPVIGGGTGKTFAWERIPSYLQQARQMNVPLFVAGGLTPDNVRVLLDNYHPEGVDVSSGVETEGMKDIDKIQAFVERVRTDEY